MSIYIYLLSFFVVVKLCNRNSVFFPDVIPIQSTNDWEAAFGFSTSSVLGPPQPGQPQQQVADSGDNDFGFDPWVECSKGLADLMEKESAYNKTTALIQRPTSNKSEFHQPFPPQFRNLSHTFTSTTPEQPPTIPTNHVSDYCFCLSLALQLSQVYTV